MDAADYGSRVQFWMSRWELSRHVRWWDFQLPVMELHGGCLRIRDTGKLVLWLPLTCLVLSLLAGAVVFFVVLAAISGSSGSLQLGGELVLAICVAAGLIASSAWWTVSRYGRGQEIDIDFVANVIEIRDDFAKPNIQRSSIQDMRIYRCDIICVNRHFTELVRRVGLCITVGERLFLLCSCKNDDTLSTYESALPRPLLQRVSPVRGLIRFMS